MPGDVADDIEFKSGETIVLVERIDGQWMRGHVLGQSKVGLFPSNFVQVRFISLCLQIP